MILTFGVGSKCAVILPQKFINPHLTPAKGIIVNRLIDSRSLILVEEVWQVLGLKIGDSFDFEETCFLEDRRIRHNKWGWQEVPQIIKDPAEYLLVEVLPTEINPISEVVLDGMIRRCINDFFEVNRKVS